MVIKFQDPRKEILDNLNNICLSNTVPGADSLYQETIRPRFHFSSPVNWLNDPNGLFYLDGTYHMYYQYNPYGWQWGNMHWGHAISKDLIHWEIKPMAIFPVGKNAPWTGSAVVDRKNTSGLKRGNSPPVLAIYARKGTGTVIEYSNDGGFTFNEYELITQLIMRYIKETNLPSIQISKSFEQYGLTISYKTVGKIALEKVFNGNIAKYQKRFPLQH